MLILHHRHDSAISRLKFPDTWWRTIEVELAGAQLDALRGANWQRGGGGENNRPTPVLPPWPTGEKQPEPKKPKMTPTEIRDELARRRELRAAQAG